MLGSSINGTSIIPWTPSRWFANSCLGAKHRQILNLVPFYNVKDSIYHLPASWGAVFPVTAEAQTAHTDVFWGKCYQAQPTCDP